MSVANCLINPSIETVEEKLIPVTIPYTILDLDIPDGIEATLFNGKPEVGVYGKYMFSLSFSVTSTDTIIDSQYTLINTDFSKTLADPTSSYIVRQISTGPAGAVAHFNISGTVDVTSASGNIEFKYTPITGGLDAAVEEAVLVWTRLYKY
jgi:hypothetical protein